MQWVAHGNDKSGEAVSSHFDIVIVSTPPAHLKSINFLPLNITSSYIESTTRHSSSRSLATFLDQAEKVTYSQRFAVGFSYPISAKRLMADVGWSFKYIYTDPVIRYICIQNGKEHRLDTPGLAHDHLTSASDQDSSAIVVHTTIEFATELSASGKASDTDYVRTVVIEALNRLIPGMSSPTASHVVYWNPSQAQNPLSSWGSSFAVFQRKTADTLSEAEICQGLTTDTACASRPTTATSDSLAPAVSRNEYQGFPALVFVGDYLSGSFFRNCVSSAYSAAQYISRVIAPER